MSKIQVTDADFKCPWNGCGASQDITGCRFSIAPMSDRYVDILINGISKVDTSKIWSETDKLSTVYRGKRVHVLDGVKACFMNCYDANIHMTLEATFSKGCPGDNDGDSYLAADDSLVNEPMLSHQHFSVSSKISFYPLGTEDYMKHIAYVVNLAIKKGLYKKSAHYVSILEGDVHELFEYFNEVLAYSEAFLSHYVLQVTLSVNSPSAE